MAKLSKRVTANNKLVDGLNKLSVADAVAKLKEAKTAKFDETVEIAVRLGVDPKRSDQMVRGSVLLPNGTGKQTTVLVFAKGDKEREAQEAGADFVGNDDLIEKIKGGWLEFDKAIATPDMMRDVGKIGRILGTRGLMPNPKVGTVTTEIAKAVKESKLGRVEFRVDKAANVHVVIGKLSFDSKKLEENFNAVIEQIVKLKPATSKGNYIKGITLTSTMGPGIKVEPNKV